MRSEATTLAPSDREFAGTDRFEIVSRLGAGGMGVVYEAIDRQSGQRVALKTLELRDASSIYRFKKEFRGLADISHRNLVNLHELVGAERQWFFTMELIRGRSLLEHLRRQSPDGPLHETEPVAEVGDGMPVSFEIAASAPAQMDSLRDAFQQLCQGVHALHLAGKLHRDIKPSNILVDEAHRVVLLDFGLATDVAESDILADTTIMGTVSYMSPEQASQKTLGPASDWYSVGIVLFEALTGQLPFQGPPLQVLMDKQARDAPDPRQYVPDLPADLSELCGQLLSRQPDARPAELDILSRLGGGGPVPSSRGQAMAFSHGDAFVGRDFELSRLHDALRLVVETGRPQCVLVHGAPGIGKTALLRQFGQMAGREHEAILLEGRCYERESVPFKAIDTIVDSLSRYLARCTAQELAAVMPEQAQALVRLFPVLRAVRSFARLGSVRQALDPQEARRRGLAALRELLTKLASSRPVIIKIDDFQWGDTDSSILLTSLLGPPDPPMVLWCICYRREDVATSLALRTLHERLATDLAQNLVTSISLERMSEAEVNDLVQTRLAAPVDGDEQPAAPLLARVASESHGNPFFVEEIMRYLQSGSDATAAISDSISLPEVIMARLERLGRAERHLLEVVAVAGAPIPEEIVLSAWQADAESDRVDGTDSATALTILRASRLLRSHGLGARANVESYHDRIREVIVESLAPSSQKDIYHRLASAYAAHDPGEHQTMATFFGRAGDTRQAANHAIKAADQAVESLAFERAAVFYRLALADTSREEDVQQRLRVALAEALYNAGMGVEAASAHLEAAKGGTRAVALEQQRLAAESYLRAGHIDQAVETFRKVLEAVHLRFAASSGRSLLRLLAGRLTLRLRGLGFTERDASKLSPETLLKIDVCGSCAFGFGLNDPIRGAEFQTRHLLLALRAGEPGRVGKALALEAVYRALDGAPARAATQKLIDVTQALASQLEDPLVDAHAASAQALLHFECGEWRPALQYFDKAADLYLRECRGHQSAACQAERLATDALFFLGELKEFSSRVPSILRAADDRGDQHGVTDMRTGCPNAAWLVRGQAEQARFECERGEKQWSERSFFLQHYYAALAHTHIDLYEHKGAQALARCDAMWPALTRSLLLRVAVVASQAHFLRGRALVLAASQLEGSERRVLLKRLDKTSRWLARQGLAAARPWSQLLSAQGALLAEREDEAVRLLRLAHQGFTDTGMRLCQETSAGLLGTLIGGDEGQELRAGMTRWMEGQGVAEPLVFARIMVPLI